MWDTFQTERSASGSGAGGDAFTVSWALHIEWTVSDWWFGMKSGQCCRTMTSPQSPHCSSSMDAQVKLSNLLFDSKSKGLQNRVQTSKCTNSLQAARLTEMFSHHHRCCVCWLCEAARWFSWNHSVTISTSGEGCRIPAEWQPTHTDSLVLVELFLEKFSALSWSHPFPLSTPQTEKTRHFVLLSLHVYTFCLWQDAPEQRRHFPAEQQWNFN